ncbi:heavy metal translocating P-type ATPase [Anaeromicropila herbilytica]|uniref:Cd(2+)-exporting ATPase n=1 Tax=Anaeromicropila herbilytica TaxID=2785025 RepID=A0A7R7IFD4_9FIRM|nr:heavy metal translocating P-type ATPase [Anaeromicropila herbilytica]BCN32976.1 cadmium-translocating P-type ATPase [Anaeromicropila herbilytica]
MANNSQKIYILENLGCANCASKMETKINNFDEIELATINFVKKQLILELKDPTQNNVSTELYEKLKKAVTSIESNVILRPLDASNTVSNTKTEYTLTESSECKDSCCDGSIHNHSHDHSLSHSHDHSHKGGDSDDKKSALLHLFRLILGFGIAIGSITLSIPNPVGIIIILLGFLILGYDVLLESFHGLRNKELFDENFLMLIAAVGAFFIGDYAEGISVMFLFQIGEFLQDLAVDKSRKQLESVLSIKPEYANIQTEDGIQTIAPEKVSIGDIIIVKPSEKVPLDGVVIEGSSFVDTSSLTGESVPRKVSTGEDILSGCINGNGTLFIKVTETYSNSTVAKVLDLVENASNKKSKTENFITKFARIYTPIVVLFAALLAVLPPIITGSYDFSTWIYRACGFLVVSCPCALVISIPLGFFGGIGNASKNGILVKGSNYLEALHSVGVAVFDKTGTLTKGIFSVSEINTVDGFDKDKLLEIAALVESYSNHPIAKSITNAYPAALNTSLVSDYEEISGHGVKAIINNMSPNNTAESVYIGNTKLLDKFQIPYPPTVEEKLGTICYIAIGDKYVGNIVISDDIKDDSKKAIRALKEMGVKTVMLTGDLTSTAKLVAKDLGIDTVYSELLPGDKVAKVEELLEQSEQGKNVIFVGDGMNDAPVLARADIGIAMGGVGSDAAIEASDIVIMTDEPSKIAKGIQIAKFTKKIVTQNIFLALGLKLLVMLLLAIGYGSMWLAVFADGGVALIAIFNSLRALKYNVNR